MKMPDYYNQDIFYSAGWVSKLFGIKTATLARWRKNGKLIESGIRFEINPENGFAYYYKEDVDRVWKELVSHPHE